MSNTFYKRSKKIKTALIAIAIIGILSLSTWQPVVDKNVSSTIEKNTLETTIQPKPVFVPVSDQSATTPPKITKSPIEGIRLMGSPWSKTPGNWWDTDWEYRINITIQETGAGSRVNWPVDVYVHFDPPAHKYSIRVVRLDSSGLPIEEVPYQPWNITYYDPTTKNYLTSATITFLANTTLGGVGKYQIYWSVNEKPLPSFTNVKRVLVRKSTTIYTFESVTEGWKIDIDMSNLMRAVNFTLATGERIGHSWLHFSPTLNPNMGQDGYLGSAHTTNTPATVAYIEEEQETLTSVFEGVIFVTVLVENATLSNMGYVNYVYRIYDFGIKVTERFHGLTSLSTGNWYYFAGWVFDQDDDSLSTFNQVFDGTSVTNLTYIYKTVSHTFNLKWSYTKIYDLTTNLPVIKVFRFSFVAGNDYKIKIKLTGSDGQKTAGNKRAASPYIRVMDPFGNWVTLQAAKPDKGTSDDGGITFYSLNNDLEVKFTPTVSGKFYIMVGSTGDISGDNVMHFDMEIKDATTDQKYLISGNTVYSGHVSGVSDPMYIIPIDAIYIDSFYPKPEYVGYSHLFDFSWTSSNDVDFLIFGENGNVRTYSISTSATGEEFFFTPTASENYTIIGVWYGGNAATLTISGVIELAEAPEALDYYGESVTWDHIAFLNTRRDRAVGMMIMNETSNNVILTGQSIVWVNNATPSGSYIYWARKAFINGVSGANNYTTISYFVYPWRAYGSSWTNKVKPFEDIYGNFTSSLTVTKDMIERFKMQVKFNVTDADGNGITNAHVSAYNASNPTQLILDAYTGTSGFVTLDLLRISYIIKVEVQGFDSLTYTKSYPMDLSLTPYWNKTLTYDVPFSNLVKMSLILYTATSPRATLSNASIYLTNSTGSWEDFTNSTGGISFYITAGSWTLEINATSSATPDVKDTFTIDDNSDFSSPLATSVTSYTFTLSTAITYYIEDEDISGATPVAKLELYNTPTYIEVEWGSRVTVGAKLLDASTNLAISGNVGLSIINSSGFKFYDDLVSTTTGIATFTINTALLPANVTYTIVFNGTSAGYLDATPIFVTLRVNPKTAVLYTAFEPSREIYWNESLTIIASYIYVNGTPVSGADVAFKILGVTPWISLVEYPDGSYRYTYQSSSLSVGTYIVEVRAFKGNHTVRYASYSLRVRERITDLNILSNLSIVWSPSYTLEVEFIDLLLPGGSYITGANISYELNDYDTGVVVSSGWTTLMSGTRYVFTIDLTGIDVGTYVLRVSGVKDNYLPQVVERFFTISLRPTTTWVETTRVTATYGEIVQVMILYIDQATGTNITGAETAYWTAVPTVEGLPEGTGVLIPFGDYYLLKIDTSELYNGTYIVDVYLGKMRYTSQHMTISLNIKLISTVAEADQYSIEKEYGENVNITLRYLVKNGTQLIGIGDADNYTYVIMNGSDVIMQGMLTNLGNGVYRLYFNSSDLGIGVYTIHIHFYKQFHESQDIIITLTVKEISTFAYTDKSSISVIWGEPADLKVYVNRARDGKGVSGAYLTISVNSTSGFVKNLAFTDLNNGTYLIHIDTTLEVGRYNILIYIYKENYSSVDLIVFFEIKAIPTILIPSQFNASIYWNETLEISVILNATYPDRGLESVIGAVVEYIVKDASGNEIISGSMLTDEKGRVTIVLKANEKLPVGFYTMYITASKQHYANKSVEIRITVMERLLSVSLSSRTINLVWGDIGTLTIQITDALSGDTINDANVVIEDNLNGSISLANYTNGVATVVIDTTVLNSTVDGRLILVTISRDHYTTSQTGFYVYVNPVSVETRVYGPKSVTLNPILGGSSTYRVGVFDASRGGKPISGADVKFALSAGGEEYELTAYPIEEEPGYYTVTINWRSLPVFKPGQSYGINIKVSNVRVDSAIVPNSVIEIQLNKEVSVSSVNVDYFGGSTRVPGLGYIPNLLFYPAVILIAAMGTIVAYKVISYMLLPPEVKEIDKILKMIEKGEFDYEAPTKEEEVMAIISEELFP